MSAELRPGSSSGLPSTVMRIRFRAERVLRRELARQRRDLDALVVVELRDLVVDDLHDDVRRLALDEARVDDVVGVHVAAALELDLRRRRAACRPRSLPSRAARARPKGRCRRRRRASCAARAARCAYSRRSASADSSCRRRRRARGAAAPSSPAGTTGSPFAIASSGSAPHGGS